MMTVPMQINDGEMDIFVILEQENIERIMKYDPAEIVRSHFGKLAGLAIRNVVITYATEQDLKVAMPLFQEGKPKEALRHLSRGYQWRPDMGDAEGPYESLLKPQ